jgi:hypothetical protein
MVFVGEMRVKKKENGNTVGKSSKVNSIFTKLNGALGMTGMINV